MLFHYVVIRSFLGLAEKVSLLCTGTESGLLARRLESMGLEDALQGLG
jgi:hypothetical protein